MWDSEGSRRSSPVARAALGEPSRVGVIPHRQQPESDPKYIGVSALLLVKSTACDRFCPQPPWSVLTRGAVSQQNRTSPMRTGRPCNT